jgi:hypothetical protein
VRPSLEQASRLGGGNHGDLRGGGLGRHPSRRWQTRESCGAGRRVACRCSSLAVRAMFSTFVLEVLAAARQAATLADCVEKFLHRRGICVKCGNQRRSVAS